MYSEQEISKETTIDYRKEQNQDKRNLTISIIVLTIIIVFLGFISQYAYEPIMIEHTYTKAEYYAEVGSFVFSLLFLVSLCSTFYYLGRYLK